MPTGSQSHGKSPIGFSKYYKSVNIFWVPFYTTQQLILFIYFDLVVDHHMPSSCIHIQKLFEAKAQSNKNKFINPHLPNFFDFANLFHFTKGMVVFFAPNHKKR